MNGIIKFLFIDKKRTVIFGRNDVFFAVTHQAIFIGHSQRIKNFSHFVGLMAINANGNTLRVFFPQLALNDFAMHLLDLAVALQTGFDDISSCDGGTRVRMRKDQMGTDDRKRMLQ